MTVPPSRPVRVVLVDGHPLARDGLRRLLDGRPDMVVVGDADSITQALDVVTREQPDVVVLELRLGREHGAELLPALGPAAAGTRVLVLTSVSDPAEHRTAVRLGASGVTIAGDTLTFEIDFDGIFRMTATLSADRRSLTGTFVGEDCGVPPNRVVPSGTWTGTHQ